MNYEREEKTKKNSIYLFKKNVIKIRELRSKNIVAFAN